MDTKTVLRNLIVHELGGAHGEEVDDEADLLASGYVDSLGLFRLVELIPERWGFKVPDEEVVLDHFTSIRTIAAYIDRRRAEMGHERDVET